MKQLVARIHLWAGLVLGLQVVLWTASGVVMSWFHIDDVKGLPNVRAAAPAPIEAAGLIPLDAAIAAAAGAAGGAVEEIALKTFLGAPVFLARGPAGAVMIDAASGQVLSPLDEARALAAARADFAGAAPDAQAEWLEAAPVDYRGALPVWRVAMGDEAGTRLYVDPATGAILARRNDLWRFYDFFWMLHIMDYEGRTDFNNPLLKTAAAAGLVFALSGLVMVGMRLRTGRYGADARLAARALRGGRRGAGRRRGV
ncbi:PepSY domain-containing protein [Amphiplicatus metriothermophilus]|uniref:PepSY-associated TM region n=1 Tax=Amphiplicatus metriothermophilus TaxID=1519374 RepID=A0A239PJ47_9PROT|nr:PepSY domain-containing protein [Amphiplicatus metriothermophilus]MBB5518076.1 hypothetical protein [Amphiplicatus metriothermophilus]SNT67590.1 PepSY-associated TM region [Amphiplicatus metriothermophilus]